MGADMKLLKELRALTSAPLKDCKQALEETDNKFAEAQEWLKQKWIMKATSKADRATKEWIVVAKKIENKTIGLKLACETDFVARNETFRWLAEQIVRMLAQSPSIEDRTHIDSWLKESIEELLKEHFVAIGENMQVIDAFVQEGESYIYTHPGNKLLAVVFYSGDEWLVKEVAMQVAAMNPQYLRIEEIWTEQREQLAMKYREEVLASGKPAEIVEKIISGKIAKDMNEIVLLEQSSIVDDTQKVKERLKDTEINSFIRYSIWG